jgi:glutathione S-transferase
MKLIGWAASPFVRKVRVVLAEKKVAFTYADKTFGPARRPLTP